MDHGAHEGHGVHQHHGMNHGDHGNIGTAAMAAVSSTVATVLSGVQNQMTGNEDSDLMDNPGDMHSHHQMDHMDMGSNMDHGSGHSMHDMIMWFHSGYSETVLFKSWSFNTIGGLIGSMIGIFIMAALYEGLKYYREYLFWKTYNAIQYRSVTLPAEKGLPPDENQIVQPTMFSWMHGFQTVLHIVQIVLSYFLMLIFMTYNIWLCLAVVLGAAVGYFLFGWKKAVIVDVTEHCH